MKKNVLNNAFFAYNLKVLICNVITIGCVRVTKFMAYKV